MSTVLEYSTHKEHVKQRRVKGVKGARQNNLFFLREDDENDAI